MYAIIDQENGLSPVRRLAITLTPNENLETYGCILSTVAQHQAISIRGAEKIFIVLDQFHIRTIHS